MGRKLPQQAPKSRLAPILIAVAVLVFGAAGAGIAWFFAAGGIVNVPTKINPPPTIEAGGTVTLEDKQREVRLIGMYLLKKFNNADGQPYDSKGVFPLNINVNRRDAWVERIRIADPVYIQLVLDPAERSARAAQEWVASHDQVPDSEIVKKGEELISPFLGEVIAAIEKLEGAR